MNLSQRSLRTHRLKLALLTSLVGKGVASVVQLLVLPMAIGALGRERFGAYAMLAAILNWMAIASVTVGPGLTVQLVSAHAAMDEQAEARSFGAALVISSVFAMLLLIGVQLLFHVVGVERLCGASYIPFAEDLRQGVSVLCIAMSANLILGVGEAAQAAYQRQYIHNAILAAGNIVTVLSISLLVRARPTIANMIIAVYFGPLLARAASLAQLLYTRRHLVASLRHVDWRAMKLMTRTGSAFLLTSVGSLCYQSFSVYWVGRSEGPPGATQMALFMTVLGTMGNLLIMFTQPLWPAIQDARARRDMAWIYRSYFRVAGLLMTFFGVAAVGLALAGNWLMHLWVRTAPNTNTLSSVLLGTYLVLVTWEHLNYSFLVGLGRIWFAALSYFVGALIMLSNSSWLVHLFGVEGMLAALCCGPLLVTAWIYPVRLRTLLAPTTEELSKLAARVT
jgi:O-antigen/teichoic acid export membrane protein